MRHPGPLYDLNDPAVGLDAIVDRLTPFSYRVNESIRQSDTILIYLGAIPDEHQAHRDMARYATEAWARLIGREVAETGNRDEAHISFEVGTVEALGYAGIAKWGDTVFVATDPIGVDDLAGSPNEKNILVDTYLHEIGHILGLAHPHEVHSPDPYDYSKQEDWLPGDSGLLSAMSYGAEWVNTVTPMVGGESVTPGIADILAVQRLYPDGRAAPVNPGDTFYGYDAEAVGIDADNWHRFAQQHTYSARVWGSVPVITLYDTGGIDTLDLSNEGMDGTGRIDALGEQLERINNTIDFTDVADVITSQVVNLNPGWTSNVYGGQANLVIANGTIIENYIAGYGDDHVTGNVADNRLEGRDGDDELDGGPGDDTLIGGSGSDTLVGGPGSDTAGYRDSPAAVSVNLETGAATGGHAGGDTLAGIENLSGSAFDDTLSGDAGDNVLEGAGGADTLAGGPGSDTAAYASSPAGVRVDLGAGTAAGGHAEGDTLSAIEHLLGSRHADTLTGDASANRLDGGPGNDRLAGGAGADTLVGGPGSDTALYAASPAPVSVHLETGAATGGHAGGDTLAGIENLTGSAFDDVLSGDAGANVLEGGAGADTLDGGPGSDTASYAGAAAGVEVRLSGTRAHRGEAAGDTLAGIENLSGSAHNDILVGDAGANVLAGLAGNDLLWGGAGDDTLAGGPGADRLVGGGGLDSASFAGSPEGVSVRLHSFAAAGGDAAGDTFPYTVDVAWTDADGAAQTDTLPDVEHLIGSSHNDILAGDARDNRLDGRAGDDTLYGGPGGGDDELAGGPGHDRLFGGEGNDTLIGGPGDDILAGGPGADTFVFGPGDGADTVTDFGSGTDKLDLRAFDIESIDEVTMTTGADGVVIDLAGLGGGSILLAELDTLPAAGDFLV